jgi:hypothetical protein
MLFFFVKVCIWFINARCRILTEIIRGWVAKLVGWVSKREWMGAKLVARPFATTAINKKGRHMQSSGQHTSKYTKKMFFL